MAPLPAVAISAPHPFVLHPVLWVGWVGGSEAFLLFSGCSRLDAQNQAQLGSSHAQDPHGPSSRAAGPGEMSPAVRMLLCLAVTRLCLCECQHLCVYRFGWMALHRQKAVLVSSICCVGSGHTVSGAGSVELLGGATSLEWWCRHRPGPGAHKGHKVRAGFADELHAQGFRPGSSLMFC